MTPAVFLAILCLGVATAAPFPDYSLDADWEDWNKSNENAYSPEEEKQKRTLWEEIMKMIKLHNRVNEPGINNITVEMNGFGNTTTEEMEKMTNDSLALTLRKGKHIQKRGDVKIPKTLDWRREGFVTPVRSQGACGACWAFAVAGAIEGQLFKKTGKLTPLSVQNLVDCSRTFGTNGCRGGKLYSAFQYVKNNGGLEAEATYPYQATEGNCRYSRERSVVKVTRFLVVPRNEEALLNALVTTGPIAVGIDAEHESFKKYTGGIYHEPKCRSNSPSHFVLLVGFGYEGQESEGKKYWLIKTAMVNNGEKTDT